MGTFGLPRSALSLCPSVGFSENLGAWSLAAGTAWLLSPGRNSDRTRWAQLRAQYTLSFILAPSCLSKTSFMWCEQTDVRPSPAHIVWAKRKLFCFSPLFLWRASLFFFSFFFMRHLKGVIVLLLGTPHPHILCSLQGQVSWICPLQPG